MTKFIVGCGYLGMRVAQAWRAAGDDVAALTRSPVRAAALAELGIRPIVADLLERESLRGLPAAETVLFAVARDRAASVSLRELYVEGLARWVDALPILPQRLIYISSTGVYGQVDGAAVDETSPCRPVREGGRACLAAEELLRSRPIGARSIILRLGGIYGPGRIPRIAEIRAGKPIAAPREGALNLIHVDDAVRVVQAAERVPPPRLYVVTDNRPPSREAYLAEIARLLHAPRPCYAPASDSPARERSSSDKRVVSDRMLAELDVALEYPSYREGLAAILAPPAAP